MVKVTPVKSVPDIDQCELNRKLRHACPRIKRWNSRINEADGDVHRLREQAINRSPIYVAVQRGSRNIQIRTKTKPKWWRKWIQEGKKYGFDESFVTPIHIPSDAYRIQRQVSFSPKKLPNTSPRRSLPVSPVKTGIHSPIKVSVLKNEQYVRSPKRESVQRGVPLLTLTPVPLNQVLKKKARIIGQVSTTFGKKGRWVEQDGSLLAVPGKEVLVYDTASETETELDDDREKRGGEILSKLLTSPSHSPTDSIRRLASAKRHDSSQSPKSPKRIPKEPVDVSEEDSESDSHQQRDFNARIKRKIRAAGQTSLYFSDRFGRQHENIVEESEEERRPTGRDKSATIRKMRATGTVRAALSPHKSPTKVISEEMPEIEANTPKHIQKKIRAIGKTTAALSPRRGPELDEFGNIIEPEVITTEKSQSSIGSIFRKIKTIARISSISRGPDAEGPGGLGSLMTRMRFLIKLSPRRNRNSTTEEEYEEEEEDDIGNIRKVIKKRPKKDKSVKGDETEVEDEEQEVLDQQKQSFISKFCGVLCSCCSKKEPELMEYESSSQNNY